MAILGDLFLCFGFFLGFLVPCFLLFCFSLLLCFLRFCFFACLLLQEFCFFAFCFSAFPCFCASLLFCFPYFFASQTNPIRYSLYEQATCCVCLMSSLQGVHGKYLGSLWEFAGSIYGYSVYSMMCR